MFIAIEGSEGAGKSSLMEFLRNNVSATYTREPGGTPFSEKLRELLLGWNGEEIDKMAEFLLVQSARVHHYNTYIQPKLSVGELVITDRFYASTLAYQGAGREMDVGHLKVLIEMTLGCVEPDLTIYLDCPVEIGFARKVNDNLDRMETLDRGFYERVRNSFIQQAADPKWVTIDATQSMEDVHQQVLKTIHTHIGE
jgi:dTMP kinase